MTKELSRDLLFDGDFAQTSLGQKIRQSANVLVDCIQNEPMFLSPNQTLDLLGTKEEFENPFNNAEHNNLLDEKLRTEYQEDMRSDLEELDRDNYFDR